MKLRTTPPTGSEVAAQMFGFAAGAYVVCSILEHRAAARAAIERARLSAAAMRPTVDGLLGKDAATSTSSSTSEDVLDDVVEAED